MKFYDAGVTIFIVIFVITCIAAGVSYEFLGPNNPIENIAVDTLEFEVKVIEKDLEGSNGSNDKSEIQQVVSPIKS